MLWEYVSREHGQSPSAVRRHIRWEWKVYKGIDSKVIHIRDGYSHPRKILLANHEIKSRNNTMITRNKISVNGELYMEVKMELFGQRLKTLRNENHMTQRAMSEMLGKTERHYQDMEAGKINVPALTLIKLADFFEVSLDYLVGRTDQR